MHVRNVLICLMLLNNGPYFLILFVERQAKLYGNNLILVLFTVTSHISIFKNDTDSTGVNM